MAYASVLLPLSLCTILEGFLNLPCQQAFIAELRMSLFYVALTTQSNLDGSYFETAIVIGMGDVVKQPKRS
jgi:hypothetical protein